MSGSPGKRVLNNSHFGRVSQSPDADVNAKYHGQILCVSHPSNQHTRPMGTTNVTTDASPKLHSCLVWKSSRSERCVLCPAGDTLHAEGIHRRHVVKPLLFKALLWGPDTTTAAHVTAGEIAECATWTYSCYGRNP